MKKFLLYLLMIPSSIILAASTFTACTDTPEDDGGVATLTAELSSIVANGAEVNVFSSNIAEYAWVVDSDDSQQPLPIVLFKEGVVVASPETNSVITLSNLEFNTTYKLYIAGKNTAGTLLDDVVEVEFTTENYAEDVTVIRMNYDGLDIHIRVPEAVKQRGNKMKWFVNNILSYSDWKNPASFFRTDAQIIQQNDLAYPGFLIHKDTTLNICEANRIFTSPLTGTQEEYWPPIAPGEPLIVSIQEVLHVDDSDEGWGAGWYGTPFLTDEYYAALEAAGGGGGGGIGWSKAITDSTRSTIPSEEDFWPEDSWHKTLWLTSKEPDVLDAKVTVGVTGYKEGDGVLPKGGLVTLVPDEEVFCYCVSVLDHALYQSVLLNYLNGDRTKLQWFTSSYYAAWSGLATTIYGSVGPASIDLADWFGGNLTPGGTYHVLVTAIAGKEGADGLEVDYARQSFEHFSFDVPEYKLPEPNIKVTGLPATDPFTVRFNIKCTNADVAPIEKASFACDYTRNFSLYLNSYDYSYSDIISLNTTLGIYMDDSDVRDINSAEGCTLIINSREAATSGLVVMGWNYEGRPSNPDAAGSQAYAESRSGDIPDAERVESSLFTELCGDWTATTTLHKTETVYITDENGNYVKNDDGSYKTEQRTIAQEVKSKVSIGDLTHPETLSDDVYKIYAESGVSREKTDAYFAEFKELTANFNRKVRGQNRLLCQGLDFDELESSYKNILNHQSAWDLFISPDYSSSSVEDGFYDFGPKWFIQIDKNGNLFVPVNTNRIAPLTNWQGAEVLFVGFDIDNNQVLLAPQSDSSDASTWPNLPIELSADKNTLTVKPYVYNAGGENDVDQYYYPNLIINTNSSYGMIPLNAKIRGNIVLTRGWSDTVSFGAEAGAETRSVAPANGKVSPLRSANGAQINRVKVYNRTTLDVITAGLKHQKVEYTAIKVKGIDREKFLK